MRSFKKILDTVLGTISCISFLCMLGVVVLQIYSRLFLPKTPSWTEEASRFLFVYMVSACGGLAIKYKAYINVDTFLNLIRPKYRLFVLLLDDAIVLVFLVFFAWGSLDFYKLGAVQRSTTLPFITMNLMYFSMLLLSASMAIYILFDLAELVRKIRRKEAGQEC